MPAAAPWRPTPLRIAAQSVCQQEKSTPRARRGRWSPTRASAYNAAPMAGPETASSARAGIKIRFARPTERLTCRRISPRSFSAEHWESLGVNTKPRALRKAVGRSSMGRVMPKVTP